MRIYSFVCFLFAFLFFCLFPYLFVYLFVLHHHQEVIERTSGMTNCVEEDGAGTNFTVTSTNTIYTVAYCLKLCYQQSLINMCGCVDGILLNHTHCDVLNTTQRKFSLGEL